MFVLLKLNNLDSYPLRETSISDKLQDYTVIGFFKSVLEIESKYRNCFARKYKMMDNNWCYFIRKPQDFVSDYQNSDMVIFDISDINNYHISNPIEEMVLIKVIRDLKIKSLYE